MKRMCEGEVRVVVRGEGGRKGLEGIEKLSVQASFSIPRGTQNRGDGSPYVILSMSTLNLDL